MVTRSHLSIPVLFTPVLLFLAVPPPPLQAQGRGGDELPTDSAALREMAEEAQTNFERYREARIPPAMQGIRTPGCDEMVGRFCLRHQGDDTPIPPLPVEVEMARVETIRTLERIGERIPGDHWVLGQRVLYLGEEGNWRRAEQLVRRCDGPEPWWCQALLGWVLHHTDRPIEAEETFRSAIEAMPTEVAREYRSVDFILDQEGRSLFEELEPEKRRSLWERLWVLSDPLYLVEGNDRLSAHWARRTLVRIREGSFMPYGMEFDEDLAELNVRYGGEQGWERVMTPPLMRGGGMRDTRQIIGRHSPDDREYLPDGEFLEDPAGIPPGAWTLDEWEPKTGYTASYAREMTPLRAQVARFRRGDSLLVVAAYRPDDEANEPERTAQQNQPQSRSRNPFLAGGGDDGWGDDGGGDDNLPTGPLESGVFLLEWDGDPVHVEEGREASDVVTAQVPNGEYVFGLEVRELEASRAWRTRQGLRQDSLALGQSAVSDILFLRKEGDPPESLEEALPRVRTEIEVDAGDAFTVAWELYGLLPGETAEVVLGFTQGEPGLLTRIGEYLRLVDPDEPIEISFEEQAPDQLGTIFRAIDVDIPSFEPGVYSLHLEVRLPGRTPMVRSRRLIVNE